ncbi:MAG: helix-turn-helix domain-containing protein, partial [Anaerovoracaceae bacterium]
TIAEAIRLGKEKSMEKQSAVYTMIDVNGVLTYWGPVMIQGTKYFMFIVDNEDSYSAAEITKLAEIIELAMGMWKYTPERDVRAEFIKALRRGNMSLAYSLRDEVDIDADEILSVFFGKGIETGTGLKMMDEFEEKKNLKIMKISEDNETYGIILGKEKDDQAKGNCIALYQELKSDKSIRLFHVTGIEGIEGAGDAYRLIGEAWSFVQNVFPYKRVFTKYELALVSNCINIQLQGGYIKKNYMELLEPFKHAGESKGRQLLDTLETFVLDAGMNSGKTAEFMGIHTNTVQYRLKKINDVLGVEITGNRVIPGLTIALALKRLERVVN